ncbi:MAG TPA: hypothetical protein VH184_04490 [Dongiaceae bacterium]|jgi:predicted  nucleic acid-binding Zn-ribbon protein|nr:hypothetical protein [Dongiaceae bacterium]
MAVQLDDQPGMQERLRTLRALIDRYRGHLAEGASRQTAAAYLQAIHAAEAEIADLERRIADLPHPEEAPPHRG